MKYFCVAEHCRNEGVNEKEIKYTLEIGKRFAPIVKTQIIHLCNKHKNYIPAKLRNLQKGA